MDGHDRQGFSKSRVYTFDRIQKSTKLQIKYIQGTTGTFQSYDAKGKSHYLMWNKKTLNWSCDCWWWASRTCANRIKYGYCKHILGLLYRYDIKNFEREAKREIEIKNEKI